MSILHRSLRRAFKPLYRTYYRWIYGIDLPGADALSALVRRWETAVGMGDIPVPGRSWDEAYARGDWACLEASDEKLRSALIAWLVDRAVEEPTILDVGCGTGVLRRELERHGYRSYTGIDISREAIERARREAGSDTVFEVADAERYAPPTSYDAVVLNESLYYLRNPIEQAGRYHGLVRTGGVLVISMFETPRTRAVGRRLGSRLPVTTRLTLEGDAGRWWIAVTQRRSER